eukprot:798703-Amphidinium_carterae.1
MGLLRLLIHTHMHIIHTHETLAHESTARTNSSMYVREALGRVHVGYGGASHEKHGIMRAIAGAMA